MKNNEIRKKNDLKLERHGEFIAQLGDRLLYRYTDGGPALTPLNPPQENPGKQGKGGKLARSVNRNARKTNR